MMMQVIVPFTLDEVGVEQEHLERNLEVTDGWTSETIAEVVNIMSVLLDEPIYALAFDFEHGFAIILTGESKTLRTAEPLPVPPAAVDGVMRGVAVWMRGEAA